MKDGMSKQSYEAWRDYVLEKASNAKIGIKTIRLHCAVPWYIPDVQVVNWMDKYYENE